MAGILGSAFGGDTKQYVQDGYELTQLLVNEFSLPGWVNGRPSTSATNEQYLDEMLDGFREGSRAEAVRKGAESLSYHPEYWAIIERALSDCALRMEAIENPNSEPWTAQASAYLKAWSSGLNPWARLGVAELLFEQGKTKLASRALQVCSLYPRYWNSRPSKEREFTLLSYLTIRDYIHRYSRSGLRDVGEPHFEESLSEEICTLKPKQH
ncbi:MAG TPA: hypothetical protein VMW15_10305 [Terracidiphilus sp.]|nr:hypothetical protein [Terracidiphilus sp.]